VSTLGEKNAPYYAARKLLKAGKEGEAFQLYSRLAQEGDPNCQVFLGWMLCEGIGTPRNRSEGFEWFKRAASVGSARGAYSCAGYLLGEKKDSEGVAYLREASRSGFPPAVLRLGICYLKGRGVVQDVERGMRLIEDAAGQGNWIAKRKLISLKIAGQYGFSGVVEGLIALPFLIAAGLISFMIHGYSDRFMG
jgi:uncharacterized protein